MELNGLKICDRCQGTGYINTWDGSRSRYGDPYTETNKVLCQKCIGKGKITEKPKESDDRDLIMI